MILAAYTFEYYLYGTLMLLIAIFLILLVLVQRGRGGGLTGALGGMGGQSAFGTKAGDTFTRITYVTAMIWIFLCMVAVKRLHRESELARGGSGAPTVDARSDKDTGAGAGATDNGGADKSSSDTGAGETSSAKGGAAESPAKSKTDE